MGGDGELLTDIRLLKNEINELHELLERKDQVIWESDRLIQLLNEQLHDKDLSNDLLAKELEDVRNSRTWRLGQFLGRRIHETRTGKLLERIIDALLAGDKRRSG